MIKTDKTIKLALIWIGIMLTIIAFKEIVPKPLLIAHASGLQNELTSSTEPVEVVIKDAIPVKIVDWNAYPSQPFKVKVDDPWPVKVQIDDDIKVKGELKLLD